MDISRLTQGEKIAGVSAIALFIFMFLAWFGLGGELGEAVEQANEFSEQFGGGSVDVPDANANAWQSFSFIDIVLFLTVLATIAAVVMKAMSRRGELPIPASVIVTALGALSTLLVLYRVIDPVSEASRKIGLFLGLIAAAGIAIGGYLAMQEEGTSFDDAADRFRDPGAGTGAGGGTAPPPPPPGGTGTGTGTGAPPPPPPPSGNP